MEKRIKEIRPNPLLTSTVEIRFLTDIKPEDVLSTYYKVFGVDYPKVTDKGIPKQIKKSNPDLQYSADYILSNDSYTFSISNNMIAFENIGTYKLWPSYFNEIKRNLEKLNTLGIIKSIIRIGIRYASIFETKNDNEKVVNLNFNIGYKGYNQFGEFFRVNLTKEDIQLHLQVIQKASVKRNNIERNGVYLDIDTFQTLNLPRNINTELYEIIDTLHSEEKRLFEFIIEPNYLKTLDVTFE